MSSRLNRESRRSRKLDLISLWWLRAVVVVLCAAAGCVAGATVEILAGGLISYTLGGLLLGSVCGALLAYRGLPYPSKAVGAAFAVVYLIPVAAFTALGLVDAPLSGVPAVVLTLPWSAPLTAAADAVRPSILDSTVTVATLMGLCAAANAVTLFGLGALLSLLARVIPR